MRLIDEDHITQAVIARHAGAEDARLRDVMTCLVQHLHGFAREVTLTEPEWRAGLRFLAEVGRASSPGHVPEHELAALSDALGLSMLVAALGRRGTGRGPVAADDAGLLVADFDPLPGQAGPVATLLRVLGRQP